MPLVLPPVSNTRAKLSLEPSLFFGPPSTPAPSQPPVVDTFNPKPTFQSKNPLWAPVPPRDQWDQFDVPIPPIPEADWKAGIRRPFGLIFSEREIQAALKTANVRAENTPFPGTRVYVPNDGKPHPAIVLLHGSEGGASGAIDIEAIEWAKRGFAVMAYSYYGAAGTPTSLARVPVDKAVEAAQWLKASPHAQNKKLAIFGFSRGGELAVLLGGLLAKDPALRDLASAVIAHAPQDRAVAGFIIDRNKIRMGIDNSGTPIPAWTYRGREIVHGTDLGLEGFDGPVFLTVGLKDELWPAEGTLDLKRKLEGTGRKPEVYLLPDEKHVLSPKAKAQMDEKRDAFLRRALGT